MKQKRDKRESMSKLSKWGKKKVEEARKEWRDTLKRKEDALGHPLGKELVREAVIIGKAAVGASKALGGPNLEGLLKEATNVSEELGVNPAFSLQKMVQKGIKVGAQVVVATLMASKLMASVLVLMPTVSPLVVSGVLLTLITALLEMLRNMLKQKLPTNLAAYL